jgi:transposase-like protein
MGMKSERRQFSQESKINADKPVIDKGIPVRKVARDHESPLRHFFYFFVHQET